MSVYCECCMLSGGLCDELIIRPDESYRLCCVVLCDLETSWMRRPWPTGRLSRKKQNRQKVPWKKEVGCPKITELRHLGYVSGSIILWKVTQCHGQSGVAVYINTFVCFQLQPVNIYNRMEAQIVNRHLIVVSFCWLMHVLAFGKANVRQLKSQEVR